MNKNLYMKKIGEKAKTASLNLSNLSINKKNSVLRQFIQYLKKNEKLILNANKKDISNAKSKNIKNSMIDRLKLDSEKIRQIRNSIKKIIIFKDPVGKTLSSWKRPNGLIIKKVSIPIGIIGVIYESRPNVTTDVSALCFKSGNVVILRGGSEAFHSNKILPVGSFNLIILSIADLICLIFLLSNLSLSIILFLIFLDFALDMSFLFAFKINFSFFFKY